MRAPGGSRGAGSEAAEGPAGAAAGSSAGGECRRARTDWPGTPAAERVKTGTGLPATGGSVQRPSGDDNDDHDGMRATSDQ
jgi:hypothetical protein